MTTDLIYDEHGLVATVETVDHGDGTGTRTTTTVAGETTVEVIALPVIEVEPDPEPLLVLADALEAVTGTTAMARQIRAAGAAVRAAITGGGA
jgi:hypothetical protein